MNPQARKDLAALLRKRVHGDAEHPPLTFEETAGFYRWVRDEHGQLGRAALGMVDRYYLLTNILHRPDAAHPWVYARCREVEAEPDGCLDLWAREHYKSTTITFAGSLQEIINDPEITIGIFSHTKPTAKKFMLQIKTEMETNVELYELYPDIFWQHPRKDAQTWSDDKGITVKRKSNPREATIEAHGLVDGQPTGAHFALRIYDDVVTLESVTTPEMVNKTTYAHDISDNLGARSASGVKRAWRVGTRYKFGDSYQALIDRKSVKVRLYPATEDGTPTGKPVLLTQQQLDTIRRDQPSAIFAAQQLMNPAAGLEAMFQKAWIKFHDIRPGTLNVYITCDPASSRKKNSDNTALLVTGIDAARNKWFLDGYHHKMRLSERWTRIRELYEKWSTTPGVQFVKVGYERYGLEDAIDYFEEKMEIERIGFPIQELNWSLLSGQSKYDRIQRLEPDFRAGKWYFPMVPLRTDEDGVEVPIPETERQKAMRESGQGYRVFAPVRRKDHEGNIYALSKKIFDEYVAYPYVTHEDGLDCLSRIYDMDPQPPVLIDYQALEPEVYSDGA